MTMINIVVVASLFIIILLAIAIAFMISTLKSKNDKHELTLMLKDLEIQRVKDLRQTDGKFAKLSERMLRKEHKVLQELSKREREIVYHLLEGKSGKEIANELYIAPGTVKNHKKNIFEKLGVHSVQELFNAVEEVLNKANGSDETEN